MSNSSLSHSSVNPETAPQEKVVLAYSGGLDTTAIIPWLKENFNYEVIAVCVDVGQGKELDGLEPKALSIGASKVIVEDATEEFVTDYIWPTLKAGAVYEGKYLLGTAMARPLIAKRLVEVALKEGATAICHGATGKGNDQVRFELAVKALAPHLRIIAPWRMWDLQSREDEIQFLQDRNIEVPVKKDDSYSRDANLWHMSHEGLELEDPANEAQFSKFLQLSNSLESAPDVPTYVELTFEQGIPTQLNGDDVTPVEMVQQLNTLAGINGIGIIDIVENRLVGIKSRGVYETPGGTILYQALQQLEQICLDKPTVSFKQKVGIEFGELLYHGEWFTPLREALSAFVDVIQSSVTGTVKLKLYKGNVIPAGVTSPNSLYNESLASFTTGDLFDHKDAEGFINLYGLTSKVRALMKQRQAPQQKPQQVPQSQNQVTT